MKKFHRLTNTVRLIVVFQMLISIIAPMGVAASAPQEIHPDFNPGEILLPELETSPEPDEQVANPHTEISAQAALTPTLEVDILGTPFVPNDPNEIGPEVFVVHAQVVNTGTVTATVVTLSLNFADDPGTGWMLLNNEVEERTKSQLDPGNTFNAYWFATYPTEEGETHQYTVTVTADSFDPITAVGTVEVVNANDTGNNFQERSGAEVTVGVSFAVTVTYNLGTNHNVASFSPAGNPDFQPGDYRLISTKTDFFDDSQILVDTFYDQLYFPTILPDYETATTLYEFTALSPTDTKLCPYTWLRIKEEPEDPYKYDKNYCDEPHTLPITGTISVEMDKITSHDTILQGETITYTINYTNNGTIPLQYAWVWDDVDPAFASVLTDTLVPNGDPTWTGEHRAAWYPDNIGAVGHEPPPRSGTVSFSAVVDGGGNDLADGDILVNHGKFGITEGRLPETVALTATSTTTIMAPTIVPTKTDGQGTVEPGSTYTYTLQVENLGSEIAEYLIVTDTLPMYLTLAGTPQPITHTIVGNQIVWDGLGSLSFGDPPLTFTVPVELDIKAPDQQVITNTMHVGYANRIGHIYNPAEGTDTTTVNGPVLTIDKTESQDPVLVARELTYEVAYSNDGNGIATGVVISDVIPADTSFEGKCSDSCNYDAPTGVITWTIASLSPGASGTVTFTVLVSELLQTGDILTNEDYGIYADQLDFTAGEPVTTTVELEAAIVQGKAFVDDNVNGILDVGEVGIENVEVTLLDALVPVKYTDAEGDFSFRVEVQKAISLTAGLPIGYFRTTPGTVYLDAMLGVTDTVVNFGYAPVTSTWGAAYVTVFEDMNYNGTQDLGENGIPGVEISSTLATTSPLTTAAHGQVTFRYEVTSTATITETDPAGYVSTTPNVLEVAVEPGTGQSVYFGDYPGIIMSGMVFDDVDVDGVNDGPPEEPGVPDAVISSGTTSYTTTVTGVYTMYLPVDGNPIEITELDPPGYLSSNAVPGEDVTKVDANTLMILTPAAGMQYTGDFGDVEATSAITISGWVWNDNGDGDGGIPANGLKEDGEPYLGGAIISLSSGLTQTTATDGAFTLYAPPGIVVTITEQNPTDYVSTNAIPGEGTGAIRVDMDTLVVPALNPGDTSAGHLFGDVYITNTAIITGYVFYDANVNGLKDPAENGFEGITVTLSIRGSGVSIPTLTDSDGVYQFAVAPGTDIQITSSGPGGDYYPTTPETVFLRPPTAGNFGNNNFGYSDDYEVAVILGTVFDDVNGNGSRDFGELGLPDAVISLTLDGSLVTSSTTTGTGIITGTYVFSVPLPVEGEPVVYGVHETNPDGYRSTTPDDVNVNVRSTQLSYQVDFGDTLREVDEFASIYGTVFHDMNRNGVLDTDESGIAGVLITLDGDYTTTTDIHGAYAFSTTIPGIHTVVEKDLTGYISTTPNEVHVEVSLGESYQVDFGDVLRDPGDFAVIYGTVFHDSNGNGLFDTSELGIEGVLITLDGLYTDTTDIYGAYTLSTTITGTHTVVERDPEGYFSTTPNEVHPTVELGDESQVDFGDALRGVDEFASIYGTVFHDGNQNATWDGDEPGIPGVEITLDGSITATTDIHGSYTFSTTITGLHTVVEKDPPKHISTTPNSVNVLGVVMGESYKVDFGDKYQEFILIYFPIVFSGGVPPQIVFYFPLIAR